MPGESDIYRQLLDERHEQIVVLLTEVRDRVAVQNGRVATLERQVAVLEERHPRVVGATITGSGVGAAVAGGLAILYELWRK